MEAFSTYPLDVALAASWFWAHRSNQTKYRGSIISEKYLSPLDDIVESANAVLINARPSIFVIRLENPGQFTMEFQSL